MARDHSLPLASWPAEVLEHEPVHGFFQRLTAANKQISVRTLAALLGLNGRNLNLGELLDFCRRLPIPNVDQLQRSTPQLERKTVTLYGESFDRRDWSITQPRVCAGCLSDSPHYRNWFDLSLLRACPIHHQPLVDGVGASKLAWWGPEIGITADGLSVLFLGKSLALEPEPVETYMLGRLGVLHRIATPMLDHEDLCDVIDASVLLGAVDYYCKTGSSNFGLVDHESRARYAPPGFQFLAQGREATLDLFRTFGDLDRMRTGEGHSNVRWWINTRLNVLRSPALASILRHSYREAASEVGVRPRRLTSGTEVVEGPSLGPRLTLKELAEKTELPIDAARALAFRLELVVPTGARRTCFAFEASAVETIERCLSNCISSREAAQMTGVAKSTFSRRWKGSGIAPIARLGRGAGYMFLKDDVARLTGYHQRSEGDQSLEKHYKPRKAALREGVSLTAAATIAGLRSGPLAAYVREGHIQAIGANKLGSRCRLSLESVRRFNAMYAPAATFAAALGCPPASAGLMLKGIGIDPLISSARTKVYRRSDIMLRLGFGDEVIRLANGDWTVDVAARLRETLTAAMSKCQMRVPSEDEATVTGGCAKTTAKLVFQPASRSICLRVECDRLGTPRRFKSLVQALSLLPAHWASAVITGSAAEGRLTLDDRYEVGPRTDDPTVAKLLSWLENRMTLMRWIFVHGIRSADAQLN